MKTRAEDLEDAVREALQMLARGRPADAQETLSAALDAPTVSERDAALREAVKALERVFYYAASDVVRGLMLEPPRRMLDAEEVRRILLARFDGKVPDGVPVEDVPGFIAGANAQIRLISERLGVDLDAAPAKDTRQTCTCLGSCKGAEGLGKGWKCALEGSR